MQNNMTYIRSFCHAIFYFLYLELTVVAYFSSYNAETVIKGMSTVLHTIWTINYLYKRKRISGPKAIPKRENIHLGGSCG